MDYFEIFSLQREPFSNSPEPDFFFQSDQHRSCLQKLELAVRLRRGLNVVMGEVGTGKTTLCRQLILNLARTPEDRDRMETHLLLDPYFSNAPEFLSALALFFGIETTIGSTTDWQLKENIKNYLFKRAIDEHKTVVLIIDEGQKLPKFCLEILREFLNYETNEYKLLQIIIFAQKEFVPMLQARQNFADRVNQYYFLKPLSFRNTVKMIKYRLKIASIDPGSTPDLFTLPALWAIYRGTGGYQRKIITLCHQVLLATIIQNKVKADYWLVRSCAGRVSPAEAVRWPRWALTLTCAAVLVSALAMNYGLPDFSSFWQQKSAVKVPLPAMTPVKPVPLESKPLKENTVSRQETEVPKASMTEPLWVTDNKKLPDTLGQLTIKESDSIIKIMERVYGRDAYRQTDIVAKANPHISSLDMVRKGEVLNLPVRSKLYYPLTPGRCWVQVAIVNNLKEAYELVIESTIPDSLLLSPCWNAHDGLMFPVLLKEEFLDEKAALSAISSLPPTLALHAKVVKGWREHTKFF